MAKKILVLPGDGIGSEIVAQTLRVVRWFGAKRGVAMEVREELFGIPAWKKHGSLMRDETWQAVLGSDAILFGAIGSPEYDKIPAEHRKVDQLLRMRKELDLFINLRPVKALDALRDASTLRPEVLQGTDMMLVRELSGGLYFGTPRGIETQADGTRRVVNTMVYTDREIERIARAAFELARTRRGRLCNVDKSNVLENGVLWRDVVMALHDKEFSDVELSHLYVDNAAMQLVRNPRQFDVILTENLFGDILSDCAAMVCGSIGMLPSVSMSAANAKGFRRALYEPIHGSAPDIAGRGIANPLGSILSFAMCLRYTLDAPQEADLLDAAVDHVVSTGCRTTVPPLPGTATSIHSNPRRCRRNGLHAANDIPIPVSSRIGGPAPLRRTHSLRPPTSMSCSDFTLTSSAPPPGKLSTRAGIAASPRPRGGRPPNAPVSNRSGSTSAPILTVEF